MAVMFGLMDVNEGPSTAFEHFLAFYKKAPKLISYDNG